ncbi:MAG TPA: CHAT domain-containing protein [Thermoanaerobaculia bacterium]|nr:CHAT domain-containing protein [Thermoanaerobaculia bacterium]
MPIEGCDKSGRKHVRALRTLLLEADNTDEAVEMLEELTTRTPADPRALSDLAAAYLVRAQRTGRAADLLLSLATAQRATERDGSLAEARFNLALAQEALRLPRLAIRSWKESLDRDASSPWAAAADRHRKSLESQESRAAATLWSLNRQRLSQAVRAGDSKAVADLIQPFPAAARQSVEEEWLAGWARDLSQGREKEAQEHLVLARAIAAGLARLTGDFHLADAVRVIDEASGPRRQALIDGHLAFGEAHAEQQAHNWAMAEEGYGRARGSFARAGSPLRAGADLGLAIALFQQPGKASLSQVLARLEPLEKEAREHRYWHLLGRILWIRALCLSFQGLPVESLASYNDSTASFARMKDRENLANIRVRKAGLFRILGERELAWREVLQALPSLPRIVALQSQHHLLGEAAAAAFDLDHPCIALLYQNQAVDMIRREMASASPQEQEERIKGLRLNLAISLRARAAIELRCDGMEEQAKRDLAEAMRLAEEPSDENIRRLLQARILEVQGQAPLSSDPRKAIDRLAQALRLAPPGEYRTFRASLHFQIARAWRRVGQRAEAEKSLQAGIEELRAEERSILSGRQRGRGEELWSACFSRFQEAYKLLILLLVEDGRPAEAFAYAEKARAFEPLDLVLQLPFAPAAFRRLAEGGEPLDLSEIRKRLPAGTFLIEYCVLDDRLLLWVIWRDGFKLLTREVDRKTLEGWTRTLQKNAFVRDGGELQAGLARPFSALLGEPLSYLEKTLGGRGAIERLVFIPDGALHGLPLAALSDPATCRPRGAADGRRVCRHLIEDFPVAVAPSATLYVYSLLRDAEIPPQKAPAVVLIAGPDRREGQRFLASREVERIRSFYPPAAVAFKNEDATVDRFFDLAQRSTVVHFAGHAVANPTSPFRSYLRLAPTKNHSGVLYAEELLRGLQLRNTRLVVLSACNSAGGHPIGSEGIAALVRPLVAAGAPAVVGSLWRVPDSATEELMVQFHRHYTGGKDAARALRHAQLDLLKKGRGLGAPLSWAAFQVIGHANPPFPPIDKDSRRDPP